LPIQFIYNQYKEGKGLAYAWWQAMHSRVDILLCGYPEKDLKFLAEKIEVELKNLEKTGNYFDPSAELYLLNQKASQGPISVSEELYHLIDTCMNYHQKTYGYFDISIKSDADKGSCMQYVKLSPENKTIYYEQEGVRLDLSGFLKGYALEKIRTLLVEYNIQDALVNMGNSSALALGNHPNGEGWKISYDNASGNEDTEVQLFNECFTTSGNEQAGRKHIINPITRTFVEGIKQISVITPTGTDGEALSTALFAAGDENRDKILANFANAREAKN